MPEGKKATHSTRNMSSSVFNKIEKVLDMEPVYLCFVQGYER